MPSRACARCGKPFQARSHGHRFCSDSCRKRGHEEGVTTAASVKVVHMATSSDGSVESAVRAELASAGRASTALGVATIALARRLDAADDETGSSLAALHRQFASSLALAMADAEVEEDELERLRARRDAKRG